MSATQPGREVTPAFITGLDAIRRLDPHMDAGRIGPVIGSVQPRSHSGS